jgi:stage IV sporulation protein FB
VRTLQFSLFGFKYNVQPGFWLFLGVVLIMGMQPGSLLHPILRTVAVAIAMIVHELGHAAVARAFKLWVRPIELGFFLGTTPHQPTTPWRSLAITLAGPGAGFALAALALLAQGGLMATGVQLPALSTLLEFTLVINVLLSAFNLLPTLPMDGGNAVRSALTVVWGERRAWQYASLLSVGVCIALALFAFNVGEFILLAFAGMFLWENLQRLRQLGVIGG